MFMNEIIALVMGVLSWVILLYCVIKHDHLDELKVTKLQVVSWMLCSIALYCPYVTLKQELAVEDIAALMDTIRAYHFSTSVLLCVTLILSFTIFFLNRKKKTIEK